MFKNSVVLSLIGADGKPATVVVGEGNQFNPQSGQTSPLAPGLITQLDQTFTSRCARCIMRSVNFTFDRTQCHISPTNGIRIDLLTP